MKQRKVHCRVAPSHTARSVLAIAACVGFGCGKATTPAPAKVVYGSMSLSNAASGDSGTYQLTSLTSCSLDPNTGYLAVGMSTGQGGSSLNLQFKGFESVAKTYTCTQSADNSASASTVGSKFDQCMVDVQVVSHDSAPALNGYSMCRTSTAIRTFTYPGTCTVDVTKATPSVQGTFSCTKMVQTSLDGAPRNPIDSSVTGDISGSFSCSY